MCLAELASCLLHGLPADSRVPACRRLEDSVLADAAADHWSARVLVLPLDVHRPSDCGKRKPSACAVAKCRPPTLTLLHLINLTSHTLLRVGLPNGVVWAMWLGETPTHAHTYPFGVSY